MEKDTKPKPALNKQVAIRLTTATKKLLDKLADKEDRDFSAYVRRLLDKHVAKYAARA